MAGAGLGLIALVKPQYLLVLLWGVLRKRWGFAWSGIACVMIGTIASFALFGFGNNLQYFGALSYMSRHGESFFENQSFNGLVNRLFGNGANLEFPVHAFPDYHLSIYVLTLVTSLALLAWAVPLRFSSSGEGRVIEFSLMAIVATAASPIAWEHHYGVVLPILVWTVTTFVTSQRWSLLHSALCVVSLLLITDDLRITNVLAAHAPWNILQSYLYFGVILLIALLRGELRPGKSDLVAS